VSWSSGAMRQDRRARTACGGFTAVTPTAEHTGWISNRASEMEALPADVAQAGETRWVARPGRRSAR